METDDCILQLLQILAVASILVCIARWSLNYYMGFVPESLKITTDKIYFYCLTILIYYQLFFCIYDFLFCSITLK